MQNVERGGCSGFILHSAFFILNLSGFLRAEERGLSFKTDTNAHTHQLVRSSKLNKPCRRLAAKQSAELGVQSEELKTGSVTLHF